MLFFISEEIAKLAERGDKEVCNALYSLGYFWRTGCCVVDGSRDSLTKLCNIPILKDNYTLILSQKQNVISLYKQIDFYLILSNVDGGFDTIIEGAIGKHINISHFKNHLKYGLSLVLCENILDYDFYKWGAEYFGEIDQSIFRIYSLGYNGGGRTTAECAKHLSDLPFLTICDNDKLYSEDDEGDTVKAIRNYYIEERPLISWKYELTAHEIENLIPLDLLCLVLGAGGFCKRMKNVKDNPFYGTFFRFFDFKEGFKKCTLREMKRNNVPSYSDLEAFLITFGVNQDRINTALRARYKKNESPLVSGVNGELLRNTINYLNTHDLIDDIVVDDHQKDDWRNIIRKIWSIGCASVPARL